MTTNVALAATYDDREYQVRTIDPTSHAIVLTTGQTEHPIAKSHDREWALKIAQSLNEVEGL